MRSPVTKDASEVPSPEVTAEESKDEARLTSGWFLESTMFPEKKVHVFEIAVLSIILVFFGTLILTIILTALFPGS